MNAVKRKRSSILLGGVLLTSLLISGCGGDDDKNESDSTPDSFTFTDYTNVDLGSYIESDTLEIKGINQDVDISIENGEYSINNGAYTDEDQEEAVSNGDKIKIRVLSADTLDTTTTATITIGGISDEFSVYTTQIPLTVRSSFKSLTFDWPSVGGAETYKVLEKPDESDGFTQIGTTTNNNSSALTVEMPIHNHNWTEAEYMLEVCNSDDCSTTDSISAYNAMKGAIGYIKSPNTESFDQFSIIAISADGGTLAVGAPGEDSQSRGINLDQGDNAYEGSGAVYIYRKADLEWQFEAYVKSHNSDEGDNFGASLALSSDGNTLIVGAPLEDGDGSDSLTNTNESSGAAYLFKRTGSTWMQMAYLKASNTEAEDKFGSKVALSTTGSTLAISAPGEDSSLSTDEADNASESNGAVYIFQQSGELWEQTAYLKPESTEKEISFGVSLSLSANGATLAVGAPYQKITTDISTYSSGSAYIFNYEASTWNRTQLLPATPSEDQGFGSAVAFSADGQTLAIGAPGNTDGEGTAAKAKAGAVSVFNIVGSSWAETAFLKATNRDENDEFGTSVALNANGSLLTVGAPGEASRAEAVGGDVLDNTHPASGAVYTFTFSDSQWSETSYVKAPNSDEGDKFGTAVRLDASGNTLLVSAPGEQSKKTGVAPTQGDNSLNTAGAVYLY